MRHLVLVVMMISYASPSLLVILSLCYSFWEAFRHCILFRMVGSASTVNTISLEGLLAAVVVHVNVLEVSHARV